MTFSIKYVMRAALRISCCTVLMLSSGCEDSQEVTKWIDATSQFKNEAIRQQQAHPFRQEQNAAFKAYFGQLTRMANLLREDVALTTQFNSAVAGLDWDNVCQKILMKNSDWQQIVDGCTKNRFFLCAEEVRAYPEVITALRGSLITAQRARFDQAISCQAAWDVQ